MFKLRGVFNTFRTKTVAIFADFIDPFCYIGYHNLWAAAEQNGIRLEWHGFELDPTTPPGGCPLETASNSDLRAGMWASVAGFARRSGLEFPEPTRVSNTRLAHQLVLKAAERNVKNPLIERIYRSYFNEQNDIGDPAVLMAMGREEGLQKKEIEAALSDVRKGRELERHRAQAHQYAFPGMPGFVYRGKIHFGALPAQIWQDLFNPR